MADEGKTAAYVSWVTFKNSLDKLGQSMPNRIDKTVFPGLSGSTLVQLLPALKFLGLIRDDGTPTEALNTLVKKNELERKQLLLELFKSHYSELFRLELNKATPSQLEEKMRDHYGVSGSTLKKALRFFLSGAAEVGVPLSSYLVTAKGIGNGGNGGRRRIARKPKTAAGQPELGARLPTAPAPSTANSKIFKLKTPGAELTVSASMDFFSLLAADRKFIYELTELIEKHEPEIELDRNLPPDQSQADTGAEE